MSGEVQRSQTRRARSRDGKVMVKKCVQCKKTAFATEDDAVSALGVVLRFGHQAMRPYLGSCGWWHLTSQFHGRAR